MGDDRRLHRVDGSVAPHRREAVMSAATPYDRVRARAEEMGLGPVDKDGGFACDCPLDHAGGSKQVFVYRKKRGGARPQCKSPRHDGELLAETFGFKLEDLLVPEPETGGCTLAQYAEAKMLPVEFLKKLGLRTTRRGGDPAVAIPHRDEHGVERSIMFRLSASPRVTKWKSGDKWMPYGLERLADARAAGRITIVEGQSDAQTLWLRGEPAIGVPSADYDVAHLATHLDGIGTVHLVVEDKPGAALIGKAARSSFADRVQLVRLDGVKDPSALHCKDPAAFPAAWQAALDAAPRLADELDQQRAARTKAARERCSDLLTSRSILDEFGRDARKLVAGEESAARLVYLALVSRVLKRPVSAIMKGASSTGKSHTTQAVLRFFPERAFHAVTSMSSKAMVFSEQDFAHRFIVIYEAAGMEDETLSYVVRSLLSEGRIRYDIAEKDANGKMVTRTIDKPGPTGLLLTTTKASINPENETRLLGIAADDTRAQTAAVLGHVADLAVEDAEPQVDFALWHALQDVIEATDARVAVPFARALASETRPVAVRLRRDFSVVIGLVKAHALVHHATRPRDARGRTVATLDDYDVVRSLVAESISEGVGASVPATVRETREAVEALYKEGGERGCSVTALAARLGIDKSAASYRARKAVGGGYVINEAAGKKGVAHSLKPGAALPEGGNVLPTREAVEAALAVTSLDQVARIVQALDGEIVERPDGPCRTCKGEEHWRDSAGRRICSQCHPPTTPAREEVAADA